MALSDDPVRRRKKKRDHHGGTNPTHRMYHREIQVVGDIKKIYQGLEKAGLIMAAQEQALNTKSNEARVYHTRYHSDRQAG